MSKMAPGGPKVCSQPFWGSFGVKCPPRASTGHHGPPRVIDPKRALSSDFRVGIGPTASPSDSTVAGGLGVAGVGDYRTGKSKMWSSLVP